MKSWIRGRLAPLAAIGILAASAAHAQTEPYNIYLSYTGNSCQSPAESMVLALAASDSYRSKIGP